MTLFNLNYLIEALYLDIITLGIRDSMYNFGGHNFSPQRVYLSSGIPLTMKMKARHSWTL